MKHNYLKRVTWVAAACGIALAACRGGPATDEPAPRPTAPLPSAGLAGQRVVIFPLTLIAAEDTLGWNDAIADRRTALDRADSIIGTLLQARAPEIGWVPPADLRRAARRSPGVAPDPDQLGTAMLRAEGLLDIPDPLRAQMRTLLALAGNRFAVVPAAVVYRRTGDQSDGPSVGTAELSIVLVDARLGRVGWRSVARGEGTDPWDALTAAVKALTPGLP